MNAGMLSEKMSQVARHHKSDVLANAYARTAARLEKMNTPFAAPLTDIDLMVIRTFINNYIKD